MNRFIAKLTGRAVRNWQAFSKTIDENVAALRAAGSPAGNYAAEVLAAQTDFTANPSPDACRRWIEMEALRAAAAVVTEDLRNLVADQRQELLKSAESRGKLRDALVEIRAGLVAKLDAVNAADRTRAEETGVEETSTNTIARIDQEIDRVDEGLKWVDADPARAVSALNTILNS